MNAIKISARFIEIIPKYRMFPETIEDKEGFIHCSGYEGNEELSTLKFIIRDFEVSKLQFYQDFLKEIAQKTMIKYPSAHFEFEVTEQYRNMT